MCYVVNNFDEAHEDFEESYSCEKNYELPDGRKILIGNERFKSAEILFSPQQAGYELEAVHKYCYDSVSKFDNDIRKDLFQNIILSGCSTLFEGMSRQTRSTTVH